MAEPSPQAAAEPPSADAREAPFGAPPVSWSGPETFGAPLPFESPSQAVFADWPNRRARTLPYWLPWSVPAFQRATLFDRPVLLFLTNAWNHQALRVLRDTYGDPDVLGALNDGFVSVLVNADRRPDVTARYQSENWPTIAFLLPNGVPMLSKVNEEGVARPIRIGPVPSREMIFFLEEGAIYHERRGDFLAGLGEEWRKRRVPELPEPGRVDEATSDLLSRWMAGNFDLEDGGFGAAPKFLPAGLSEYSGLRAARQAPATREIAIETLESLVSSPLYDTRHGGIHRIALAPSWGNIQYEKLLDRNVDFMRELTYELRQRPSDELERALRQTAAFVTSTLARDGGGFFNAQIADVDSVDGGGYWTAPAGERPAPPVDPLVLAGSNALAAAALARTGAVLSDPDLERAAVAAADMVLEAGHVAGRGAEHVIEPNPEPYLRFLVAQSDVAFGLVDLYESTGERRYLEAARDIADFALRNLSAPGEIPLRDHLAEGATIGLLANPRRPVRANARLARVLLRLDYHGVGEDYRDQGVSILASLSGPMAEYGLQGIELALGIEEAIRRPLVVRIMGAPESEETRALRRAAVAAAWPWTIVATGERTGEPRAELEILGGRRVVSDAAALEALVTEMAGPLADGAAP